MKNTFFLCFFIGYIGIAQWTYKNGGNKFDGEYKTASVIGKGGEWPYTKPTFVINKFGENEPNIYLAGIGYTGCSNSTISFAFDDLDDILVFSSSSDNENEAAFVDGTVYEKNNLLELLKTKSKVYVRFENSCSKNDFVFGLSGSTNAINFVVGNYYKGQIKNMEKFMEEKRKVDSIRNEIRLKEIKERKRMDSIIAVKKKEKIDNEIEGFEDVLFSAFDFTGLSVNARPLKTLFSFRPTNTIKVKYCKKRNSLGSIFYDNDQSLFKSDLIEVINRFEEGCLRLDVFNSNKKLVHTIYLSLQEFSKLEGDTRLQLIQSEWSNLLSMHDN